MRTSRYILGVMAVVTLLVMSYPTAAQEASWWEPADPEPGDLITIYYDASIGTIPTSASLIKLHWGINEIGSGNWTQPPPSMWPPGSVPQPPAAVQSPMTEIENNLWALDIQTNDSTYTLHYVFTDGSNWDNNNSQNWDIILGDPPAVINTYHKFIYDTRSAFATYGLSDINSITVAGTFNDWNSSNRPLTGPDVNGVYQTELIVPATGTSYKFVINGNLWTQDPDNPHTDGSQYGNSYVELAPDTLPYFTQVEPPEGVIYEPGHSFPVTALLRPSDTGPGISGNPTIQLDDEPAVPASYDPITGVLSEGLILYVEGIHAITLSAEDSSGRVGTYTLPIGIFWYSDGYHAIDAEDDDIGGGAYTYPIVSSDAADLLYCYLHDADDGDSLGVEIGLADITHETRVLLQICTEVGGFYVTPPLFDTEIATADWNGNGIQICLADPDSPDYNPAIHNILQISRNPLQTGITVDVTEDAISYNVFHFEIAVDDLEDILGTYNRGWYYGIYSFLEGPEGTAGHSWEIDAAHGGLDQGYDPDGFDALFMDNRDLQQIMFNNFSGNRTCTIDNEGRGFVLLEPDAIGPNIGSLGPALEILTRGALTIDSLQTITGIVDAVNPVTVFIYQEVGLVSYPYMASNVTDTFEVEIELEEGANIIWAEASEGGENGVSPAIIFDLYVENAPDAEIVTSYDGGIVTLDASASTDPQGQAIDFTWTADPDNPEPITLIDPNSAICTFEAPDTPGEYYIDLELEDTENNITNARTFAAVYADSVHPFSLNESAGWVQDMILYEIFPRSYSVDHQLSSITADLERISDMGFTAIWLMPIYPGPTDHGYEIVDYYGIEEDYGTPEDFLELVEMAHSWDIRIVLDLVINHSSIQHPFMQDALAFGPFSHYWDYYDRDGQGNYTYYYDWLSLPNLNYDNPEVWWEFINVSKYWVETYDVDGFRCDVAWGPQARNPDFWPVWHEALKEIKPEVFLLAEASSTDFTYFDYRFDAAMDWNLHHEGAVNLQNMFPGPPNLTDLNTVITNYGFPYPQYHYPLRFMENHDEERYINLATADETKLAATLLYTIPGIPQIYSGQEIGFTS
ncbi:hypothetical protein KJ564_04160, partial [bacterium]|nr:hypothetical protein [bacterium]